MFPSECHPSKHKLPQVAGLVGFSHAPGRRPVSPLAWLPPAKVDKSLPMLDGDDDGGGDGDGDGDGDCDGDENG